MAAEALLTELHAAERASSALLDQRDELLGRLLARRQQALILAARGRRLDPDAELLADRAEALLREVPTPLAEATALMADYEDHLRTV